MHMFFTIQDKLHFYFQYMYVYCLLLLVFKIIYFTKKKKKNNKYGINSHILIVTFDSVVIYLYKRKYNGTSFIWLHNLAID